MVLIGPLAAALVCIVLGVVFASGPWFLASLVASAIGGYLLWRQREQSGAGGQPGDELGTPRRTQAQRTDVNAQVWVIDGEPHFHAEHCGRISGREIEAVPYAQAVADRFTRCADCQATAVPSDPAVPSEPAVQNEPADEQDASPAPTGAERDETIRDATAAEVWVVDGRPRYHLAGCPVIEGQDAEPVSATQATDDSFLPCSMCEPHVTAV